MTVDEREEYQVPKGTVIFHQGDPGDEMFVISEGRVRLTLGAEGHEKEIAVLNKGDFFGELSLLSGSVRSATAEAVQDSVLLPIGRDAFKMMVQDDLDIVFRMMNIQGQRLSQTNRPIQELMQRMGRIRILTEGVERFLVAYGQSPVTLDVSELAQDLGISVREVDATVADAVQRGGGTLSDGQWTIEGRGHAKIILEVLSLYAAGRIGGVLS
jgi:CRP/FNR family cyclic AMP-dependent transcriptional regulator